MESFDRNFVKNFFIIKANFYPVGHFLGGAIGKSQT